MELRFAPHFSHIVVQTVTVAFFLLLLCYESVFASEINFNSYLLCSWKTDNKN